MSQEDQDSSPLPIVGMLALASLAVGVFLYQAPLKSDRPGDLRVEKSAMVGQQVLARMWEDPLEAIARHKESEMDEKKAPSHKHSLKAFREAFRKRVGVESQTKSVTVLAVIIESDPYVEGKEQRLRKRYAVLSALGEAGYEPVDTGHLYYFESAENTNVPFEWYETRKIKVEKGSRQQDVLILWLTEDWKYWPKGNHPCRMMADKQGGFLHDMANLMCDLKQMRAEKLDVNLRILGPSGSGMLREWVKEAAGLAKTLPSAQHVKQFLTPTTIYSYSATADPAILYSAPADPAILYKEDEVKPFENIGIHFERTINTDHELADVLIDELARRGLDIPIDPKAPRSDHRDHIALIAEWDSFYGRALPLTFVATTQEKANGESFPVIAKNLKNRVKWPENKPSDSDGPWEWIHSYVYLQGLDGATSGRAATTSETPEGEKDAGKSANDKKQNRFDTTYLERPEGQSQFDYIRRLTMSIERDNERLKREGKQFSAIGVLGSDVYDKLLILQALRKNFSNVIFFTTDLDGRLFHPDEFQWSRNLVVASAYGLELNRDWQKETPPFRSSYQTALFLSTLKALDIPVHSSSKTADPRLYEIGRRGAVELPRGSAFDVASNILQRDGWLFDEPSKKSPDQSIHPSPSPVLAKPLTIIGALFAPSLLACMIALISQTYWTRARRLSVGRILRWVLVITVVFLFLYVFVHVQLEPFSIFDGVSIWPTEIIRIIVILLGLYFFHKAKRDLAEGDRRIAHLFHFAVYTEESNGWRFSQWWPTLRDFYARYGKAKPQTDDAAQEPSLDMMSLWDRYRRDAQWRNRWVRVAPLMGLALLIALVMMYLFGLPFVPFRGAVSHSTDKVILGLASFVTIALLFFVLDASRLTAWSIRQLAGTTPIWPHAVVKEYKEKRNMAEPDLNAWLTIKFIGMLTSSVGKLIYYPFIAVALLIGARSRYFDAWDFPLGLLIMFGVNVTYAITSAFVLRAVAEQARTAAIERARERLIHVKGEKENTDAQDEQIQITIEEIENNREGAFAPFLYQPAFGAFLIPSGGIGLLALMEYFVQGK